MGQHSAGVGQCCHMKMSLSIKEPSNGIFIKNWGELKCYLISKNSIQMKVTLLHGAICITSGEVKDTYLKSLWSKWEVHPDMGLMPYEWHQSMIIALCFKHLFKAPLISLLPFPELSEPIIVISQAVTEMCSFPASYFKHYLKLW